MSDSGPRNASAGANDAPPSAVSFAEALRFWLRLGFISFGGPAGQIAIMHDALVTRRRWISERRFLHALNYCMLLPGPEAQQLATYIGWLLHGIRGGIVAGALFVLPSLAVLVGLSWLYVSFGHVPAVAAILYGIKPAVVAIVLHAVHRIGSRALRNGWLAAVAVASLVAITAFGVPFPAIVLAAAVIGVLGGRLAPHLFRGGLGHTSHHTSAWPALIGDGTPVPAHATFSWPRLGVVLATGLVLWAVPMGLVVSTLGRDHLFANMGWFFTKAALLTFGGAYAVLPYVYQASVVDYGWLSASQMIDGLALGETTPGPLIMVVAFVGFVGAHGQAISAGQPAFLFAATAAALVTWFTFLPSFVFILAGGPVVESTRDDLAYTAPLTAVTAAVVGVIASLFLFFGYHVLWPGGFEGSVDGLALALAAGAAVALFRWRWSVIRVIGVCAALGWFLSLIVRTFVW